MATQNLGFAPSIGVGYKFEPARNFRWELDVDNLAEFSIIKLALKTCDRPSVTQEATVIEHFNDRFYIAGKTTFSELKCTAYEAIPNSPTGLTTSELMANWKNLIFDPFTNIMLPGSQYKRTATLTMNDGAGNVIFGYKLLGIWPMIVAPSPLDYGNSEAATLDITFKVDKSVLTDRNMQAYAGITAAVQV